MRRAHRTAHARIWQALALLLPLALAIALASRPRIPIERPAIRIAPPEAAAP
jgi:hypothetical protein